MTASSSQRNKPATGRPDWKKQNSDKTLDMSEGDLGNLCRQLKDNDPEVTTVTLGEQGLTPQKASRLGASLEGNTKVNKIILDFDFAKAFCGSVFSFVKYIEKSESLRTVVLLNVDMNDLKVSSALLVLLPGVAKNSLIETFEMRAGQTVYRNIFVALWYTIMAALFGGSATINMLQTSVAFSLTQCQSLENVVLEHLPDGFNAQVLSALSEFNALTSLTFIPKDYSMETVNAMAALVRNSLTLETLQLEGLQFNPNNFMPVAEGLVESMSIKELSISNCAFKSSSTQMLEDVATTVTKLTVGSDVKLSRPTSKVMANIVLQTEETTLKELDLAACPMPGKHLTRFLSSISERDSLVLERLWLPSAKSSGDIEAIKQAMTALPNLKELSIANFDVDPQQRNEFVAVLKENLSLVRCRLNEDDIILQKPKQDSFRFSMDREDSSSRRSKSFRKIQQTNEKGEFLQGSRTLFSDSEDESQSHREKMVDSVKRHGLSDRVLDVLKDGESDTA